MALKLNYDGIKNFFMKYRYAALILLIGIGLMLLPEGISSKKTETIAVNKQPETVSDSEQLAMILEQIHGAGKVQVLLSVKTGEEVLYQTDTKTDSSENADTHHVDTVIVSDSGRQESGLVRQIIPPVYLGAVVVCEGGDSSAIRLEITEAVSKITGLGADRIVVLKMK